MKSYYCAALLALGCWTATAQTLSAALDGAGLTWSTGGTANWAGQSSVTHDGGDAARSGRVTDGQESWVQTTVTGPGIVSFWWMVSSEGACDYLEFYIGATRKAATSGEPNWKHVAFDVPSGTQTLKWRYIKDIGTDLGYDAGFLDEVEYTRNLTAPTIALPPAAQKVGVGGTVTLKAAIAGAAPITYQWYLNETNALAAGTSSTLTIPNATVGASGRYSLMASNAAGAIITAPVEVTVTPLRSPENILFYVDGVNVNAIANALIKEGRPYQSFGLATSGAFNKAIETADPANSFVIVDCYNNAAEFQDLIDYVKRGGRALFQFWYLGELTALPNVQVANAFNAAAAQQLNSPGSIYNWNSTIFTGVATPLTFSDLFQVDGQRLTVYGAGQALSGYTTSATAGQAAVILGNAGRTILNGFFLEEASNPTAAARFAQNEIDLLVGAPVLTTPSISAQPREQKALVGGSITMTVTASGTPPLSYQWYAKGEQNVAISGATSASFSLTKLTAAQSGTYYVVISNAQGSTQSADVKVSVSEQGQVTNVLVLADLPGSTPYEPALNEAGYPHQLFSSEAPFNAAVLSADPANTAIVVDAPNYGHDMSAVTAFLNAGGRTVLEYWNLVGEPGLRSALGISVGSTFTMPIPITGTAGSPLFSGLTLPIAVSEAGFNIDGMALTVLSGGKALAGYTTGQLGAASVAQTANGRAIVNGFFVEDITPQSDGIKFIQNELILAIGTPPPTAPVITGQPANVIAAYTAYATFGVTVRGTGPFTYHWYLNDVLLESIPGVQAEGATTATLTMKVLRQSYAGKYKVVVGNALGNVTSEEATLSLVSLAPVTNILLFTDDTDSLTPFKDALVAHGLQFRLYNTENLFDSAVASSDFRSSLAIVDSSFVAGAQFLGLEKFVRNGGRAVFQYWDLAQHANLVKAFGLEAASNIPLVNAVFQWKATVGKSLPLELTFSPRGLTIEGQTLTADSMSLAVAGFSSSEEAGFGAIVVGNTSRTVVNGFYAKEISSGSYAAQLAWNEIELVMAAVAEPAPNKLTITGRWTADGHFEISTDQPVDFLDVEGSSDLVTWEFLGKAVQMPSGKFIYTHTPNAAKTAQFFRVKTL